jgi:hypothetical protein
MLIAAPETGNFFSDTGTGKIQYKSCYIVSSQKTFWNCMVRSSEKQSAKVLYGQVERSRDLIDEVNKVIFRLRSK